MSSLLSLGCFILCLLAGLSSATKIGVIGGGISGTFVSKYLIDFNDDCSLDEITIFDPLPLGETITKDKVSNPDWQGSRVSTYELEDGRIVELGASVIIDQFENVIEMARNGKLTIGRPFSTGFGSREEDMKDGMAIYDGNGSILFNSANSTRSSLVQAMYRYNLDILKLYFSASGAMQHFLDLQDMLKETDRYFFRSPVEMWKEVGLLPYVHMSLDYFCDQLWLPEELPWWRQLIPGQGSVRRELLESVTLVNYNQDNLGINALAGLASFSAIGRTKSIVGGNAQLIKSAFEQANQLQAKKCPEKKDIISHSQQQIATIVGSLSGFELYDNDGSMVGQYDIVIVAAPLSMAKIEFLIKSHIDEAILQPMPMNGLVRNHDDGAIPEDHEGNSPLPKKLPPSATRPYTQVITTLVRHAEIQADYFSIEEDYVPRGIHMTAKGKALEHSVTSILQISSKDGLYKVFSSQPLSPETITNFFGTSAVIEYEKIWGGRHGGATPDYQGDGETTEFLLYDGATGFHGHTHSGALYYPLAMELTLACVESSAMGAKAVSKLIAKRLGWIEETYDPAKEEL